MYTIQRKRKFTVSIIITIEGHHNRIGKQKNDASLGHLTEINTAANKLTQNSSHHQNPDANTYHYETKSTNIVICIN